MLAVINRGKDAKRFGEGAPVNRDVLFTFQGGFQIVANKMQANQRFVWVRVANTAHVGHHGEQQIVALGDRFGDGLNDVGLRGLHQASLDLRAVGQRAGDTQCGVFDIIAGGPGDLNGVERKDQKQHRGNNRAYHQRDQRVQFHGALARQKERLQIAHQYSAMINKGVIIADDARFLKPCKGVDLVLFS